MSTTSLPRTGETDRGFAEQADTETPGAGAAGDEQGAGIVTATEGE